MKDDDDDTTTDQATIPVTLVTPHNTVEGIIPGPQGKRGPRGAGAFRQFAVIAVFIMLVSLVLAYLVQQGREYALEQCEVRREAVIHTNRTWDQLTAIEEIPIPTTSEASKVRIAARVKVYADAKVPVPDCRHP